jgi:hypothetical protein
MNGGYRYGKTKAGQRKPSPDKNEYSHVADALQYVCLSAHGGVKGSYLTFIDRHMKNETMRAPMPAAGWT